MRLVHHYLNHFMNTELHPVIIISMEMIVVYYVSRFKWTLFVSHLD